MSPDVSVKKVLVLAGTLILVSALCLSACTSRVIPPSEEYLSPPEPEKVEYIAKPPSELAKRLFSSGISEQSRESTWSDAQGKWVVWAGNVHHVEPQLKPSRIIFLDEYETSSMSFDSGQFTVTVKFDPAWTQQLKQLTTGELVYYRAKLVKYDLGLGSNLLTLEEGEIIHRDDVAAKLIDLAYSSYEQLENLVEEAERVDAVRRFFEDKLDRGIIGIVAETAIGLIKVKVYDEPWLEVMPLDQKRNQRDSFRFEMEDALERALVFLHSEKSDGDFREDIERKSGSHIRMVESIVQARMALESCWEVFRRQPGDIDTTDIVGVITTLLRDPKISVPVRVVEGWARCQNLDEYEQIVGSCYSLLKLVDGCMEQIHDGVIEVSDQIVR